MGKLKQPRMMTGCTERVILMGPDNPSEARVHVQASSAGAQHPDLKHPPIPAVQTASRADYKLPLVGEAYSKKADHCPLFPQRLLGPQDSEVVETRGQDTELLRVTHGRKVDRGLGTLRALAVWNRAHTERPGALWTHQNV